MTARLVAAGKVVVALVHAMELHISHCTNHMPRDMGTSYLRTEAGFLVPFTTLFATIAPCHGGLKNQKI